MFTNLLIDNKDHVRVITINRPDQLNALNRSTIAELDKALNDAEAEKSVRVVIITGSGIKAFVAGADIKEFADLSTADGKALSAEGHKKLFDHAERLNKPVIAAVNGFALGGGLELAMSATSASLARPRAWACGSNPGVDPGYGGTQRLPRLVGKGKANGNDLHRRYGQRNRCPAMGLGEPSGAR